jgi:OmpA-OmpF porin, OOP family
MKCHPLRWLWGIIPLAIFTVIAVYSIRAPVERDLTNRTTEALRSAGLGWADVKFTGRDGILSGTATEESEPPKALEIARSMAGVRVIEGRAELLRKVENYVWSATHTDGKISLSGFVPNDMAKKAILASVKASFPKVAVEDKLEFARGNPPVEGWLSGIGFGLKQLASLKSGVAELTGMNLTLVGEANSSSAYKGIKTALTGNLPKGVNLAAERVTAPLVANYVWLAKLAANQVTLSGFAPNEKVREQIVAHAKKVFGKTPVVDKLDLGEGAPDGYEKATIAGIDQLATLQEGSADLRGAQITLTGMAADDAIADATRKAFVSQVPNTIKTAEAIKAAKPTIGSIAPYVTRVTAGASGIDVTGFVPSDAARATLIAAVKARFPGKTVNDKLQLGAGEPTGHDSCLMAGLGGLGRLGAGSLALTDKQLELNGQTEDEALAIALPADVRLAAKQACDTKVVVAYDDSKKRMAAEVAAAQAKREAEATAVAQAPSAAQVEAKKNIADLEIAKREAEVAKAEAEKTAVEARRLAEAALADQNKKREAAAVCQADLRGAASRGLIQFERASDVIDKASRPTLKTLATIANDCPNALIEIEGHTDSEGTPERNKNLSERRSQSVLDFLVNAGVSSDRIKAVGYGETRPVAPNDTAENRAKNRRIEFSVSSQ